jgi:fumarylacetoacetase
MSEEPVSNPSNPDLESFVDIARDSDFPIHNLPYGSFVRSDASGPRVGVAIGDRVLDLTVVEEAGLLSVPGSRGARVFAAGTLNGLMALGRPAWRAVRGRIGELLRADNPELRDSQTVRDRALVRQADVEMRLPAEIGDYTDFYSSRHHAFNVGTMFRGPENALMPNWVWLPVAYHGRSSSIVVSGTDVRRPRGQQIAAGASTPVFGPSRLVDYELEMGFFVGPGNGLGRPIALAEADEHIFGMVIVNDWSARDIQKWEYQPLGPFLAKNFATTVSPWVVTMDALEPFRCEGPVQEPEPLDYLVSPGRRSYDISLEVWLRPSESGDEVRLSRGNFNDLYWDIRQQLTHHTVSGCNMRPGDLLASGTISGESKNSRGCLLELTWRGSEPVKLPSGEELKFLRDGDEVLMRGWCERAGMRIGFGECAGRLLPAAE